jgi:type I restriction enzyme S subunit
MIKSGATTGNIAIVETTEEFSIWSPLALIRCDKTVLFYKYLFHYMQSYRFRQQVEQFWNYGTQQNIGMGVIGNLFISLPSIDEQQQIAEYLDEKCSNIDNLITQKQQLLSELENYKKSLIYECVTGKREVN